MLEKCGLFCGRRTVWLRWGETAVQPGREKSYTHVTAAALRAKESVMETVTTVRENAADILASAKDINAQRAEQETVVEDTDE